MLLKEIGFEYCIDGVGEVLERSTCPKIGFECPLTLPSSLRRNICREFSHVEQFNLTDLQSAYISDLIKGQVNVMMILYAQCLYI